MANIVDLEALEYEFQEPGETPGAFKSIAGTLSTPVRAPMFCITGAKHGGAQEVQAGHTPTQQPMYHNNF